MAEQKVDSLLAAEARVTVISPAVTARLAEWAQRHELQLHARAYRAGDLDGAFLVYAATDDPQVQAQLVAEAQQAGILINVVDRPELCDYTIPSVVRRGDLLIATSTGGKSPALAQRIRHEIEAIIGPEYDVALRLLGRLRERLSPTSPASRQRILIALVNSPLLDYLRHHQIEAVDHLLAATAGAGVSLASLGVELR